MTRPMHRGTLVVPTPADWTEEDMAATVREAIRELLEQTMTTIDTLLEASDRELPMPSSHACAQGKDVWTPGREPHRRVLLDRAVHRRRRRCRRAAGAPDIGAGRRSRAHGRRRLAASHRAARPRARPRRAHARPRASPR